MLIFAIIMGCVGTVIALVSLFLSALVLNSTISPQPNIIIQKDTPEDNTDTSKDYNRGYDDGRDILMHTIHLTLYDMYRTHDVLDFEGELEQLFDRMNTIVTNDAYRTETIEHMNEYLKGREDDTNDY